jgi:hypothetical protein
MSDHAHQIGERLFLDRQRALLRKDRAVVLPTSMSSCASLASVVRGTDD